MTLAQKQNDSPRVVQFEIGELLGIGMTVVVLGIGLAFGLQVLGDIKNDTGESACAEAAGYWNESTQVCQVSGANTTTKAGNPAEYNATTQTITGVAKIPEKLPIIVTVIIAAVIIGVLITYLWARFQR